MHRSVVFDNKSNLFNFYPEVKQIYIFIFENMVFVENIMANLYFTLNINFSIKKDSVQFSVSN